MMESKATDVKTIYVKKESLLQVMVKINLDHSYEAQLSHTINAQ